MIKNQGLNLFVPEFNLSTPIQVCRTCEELFSSHGLFLFPTNKIVLISEISGLTIGFAFGLDSAGYFYGSYGAILGGAIGLGLGWLLGNLLLFVGLERLSFSLRLKKLIKKGDYPKAIQLVENFREKKIKLENRKETWLKTLNRVLTEWKDKIFGQFYPVPEKILISCLFALEGILREALGDTEPAISQYQSALESYPANAFVAYALLSLLEREEFSAYEQEKKIKINYLLLEQVFLELNQTRGGLASLVLKLYGHFLDEKLKKLPQGEAGINLTIKPLEKKETQPGFYQTDYYLRLVENPGSPVSSGILEIEGEEMVVIRLAPMPFQLAYYLASVMKAELERKRHPDQQGWVSVQELTEKLPWTIGEIDYSNVHKLVYKLRRAFRESGIEENLIEYNNGYYRLSTPPEKIQIEHFNPEK